MSSIGTESLENRLLKFNFHILHFRKLDLWFVNIFIKYKYFRCTSISLLVNWEGSELLKFDVKFIKTPFWWRNLVTWKFSNIFFGVYSHIFSSFISSYHLSHIIFIVSNKYCSICNLTIIKQKLFKILISDQTSEKGVKSTTTNPLVKQKPQFNEFKLIGVGKQFNQKSEEKYIIAPISLSNSTPHSSFHRVISTNVWREATTFRSIIGRGEHEFSSP